MKQLSTALPPMQNIAETQASLTKMQSDGQEMQSGIMNIQPVKPLINHSKGLKEVREQSQSIHSLVMQNKPRKCWGGYRREESPNAQYPERMDIVYYRSFTHDLPNVNDETWSMIEHAQKPLHSDYIIDMLARYVAVHKRMNVSDDKRPLLFADYASALYGLPEYALMLAMVELIEKDDDVWFPTCAKIKQLAEKYVVKYPEKLEGEEKMK